MKQSGAFNLAEANIERGEILVLKEKSFHLKNVAIVTGAASGIGKATAIALGVNGLTVVALDVNEEHGWEMVKIARDFGAHVIFVKTDLCKDEEIVNCVRKASECGSIKFLANIAGIQHTDMIAKFPMDAYDLIQRIMLRAPFFLSKLCIPFMRDSEDGVGVIGNMCSIRGHVGTSNKSAYNIAKFGLRGLTQSIAAEGDGKIRSFSVSVGYVKTPLVLNQIPDQARQLGISIEEVVRTVMLDRCKVKEMMNPIEVANLFTIGFSNLGKYLRVIVKCCVWSIRQRSSFPRLHRRILFHELLSLTSGSHKDVAIVSGHPDKA